MPELDGLAPLPTAVVGVIGGGTMGAGIATAALLAGRSVTMIERDEAALGRGLETVRGHLGGALKRGKLDEAGHAAAVGRLSGATDYAALAGADLVIEAVFEDMEVKRAVFAELDRVTRAEAVLATNTSYLDVNRIAEAVRDPGRVVGLHFFSPAHVMKLVEVIRTDAVRPEVLATALGFARDLGKVAVPSGVCDGFIGNRIMSVYRREADYMLEDGALPQEVDAAMVEFGFPMGVFAMQDLAGLDIAWAMRKRRAATRPAAERYVEIADRLCEMGRLGRKTGAGWYDYVDGKAAAVAGDGGDHPGGVGAAGDRAAGVLGRGDHGAHPRGDAGGGAGDRRRGDRGIAGGGGCGDGERLRLPAPARAGRCGCSAEAFALRGRGVESAL